MFSGFMVNTWLEGSVMAAVAGLVGFFVVLRGSTFAAHAIPQGAFAGAAGAALVGVNTLVGTGAFALLGVGAIAFWSRRGRNDVVTALVLVALLGVGSLFLSLSREYAQQAFSLLFGSPLAVSSSELLPTAALGAICVALLATLYRPLLLGSVAPELAITGSVHPERAELGFLLAVGAATTMALPVVGALLVFSLMIGPPAAARQLADRPTLAMGLSAALALVTVWVAIAASFKTNWPVGFFVGTFSAVWYVAGRAWGVWSHRAGASGGRTPRGELALGRAR
jgi:zinc/manganese transport system permease protein